MTALSREHLAPLVKAWTDAVKEGRITWEDGNRFVDEIWAVLAEHRVHGVFPPPKPEEPASGQT
jgi:polyhydroxyalkanoate synthesis regulator phasin